MYDAQSYGGGRTGGNSPGQRGPQGARPAAPQGGAPSGGSGRAPVPLRPVTIRMIIQAQRVGDGALTISGQEAGIVTIAGRVLEVSTENTSAQNVARSHTYKISDGTGIMTVRQWFDQTATAAPQEVGSMVAATGNVKIYQEKPTLTGSVRVMQDANELTFHLLDCINVHLRLTQGDRSPAGAKLKSELGAGSPQQQQQQQLQRPAYAANPAAPAAVGGHVPNGLEQAIHRVMMTGDRSTGMSPAEVHSKLAGLGLGNFPLAQVEAQLKILGDGGFYYPTGNGRYSF